MYLAQRDKCTGCGACVDACPTNCLTMNTDQDGFAYPTLVCEDKCVHCRKCEKVCSVQQECVQLSKCTTAYAAYTKDNLVRNSSSSGGIFTEIAKQIIALGGVVFGAAYDENFVVCHICVDSIEELWRLRGAKYSESKLGNCYKSIKVLLDRNTPVLFSGTPCQVAGLKSYLPRDYECLICVDFVCHGVPSPVVWNKYIQYRSERDNQGSPPSSINLRCKDTGWSHYAYSCMFKYENGKRFVQKNSINEFMKLFVGNYILRKSCESCKFKGYDRVSDFTLGDFWGIWDIDKEMDDNRGTSLVLIHSEKGSQILSLIKDQVVIKPMTLENASMQNPSLLYPSVSKDSRDQTLMIIRENGFAACLDHLSRDVQRPHGNRVWNKIRSFLSKNFLF